MADKKPQPISEGYQPLQKGYQPTSNPLTVPVGDKVQGGYQPPTTSEAKPAVAQPPKKP